MSVQCARSVPCLGHAVCQCQGTELGAGSCRDELEGITRAGGVSSGCVWQGCCAATRFGIHTTG